jgi:hypothetical protein
MDAADAEALHALACNRFGMPLATGRMLEHVPGVAKIGRMAVLAEARSCGVGRDVLDALMTAAKARGDREALLHAQRRRCRSTCGPDSPPAGRSSKRRASPRRDDAGALSAQATGLLGLSRLRTRFLRSACAAPDGSSASETGPITAVSPTPSWLYFGGQSFSTDRRSSARLVAGPKLRSKTWVTRRLATRSVITSVEQRVP